MESFYKLDMLVVSVNLYEFIGETKTTVTKKKILFRILNWLILCVALAYVAVNFLYIEGEYYVKTLQSMSYLTQVSFASVEFYERSLCLMFPAATKICIISKTESNYSTYDMEHTNKILELSMFW